jgi:ParB family transcriptional regulator, chromosome partitioning protein
MPNTIQGATTVEQKVIPVGELLKLAPDEIVPSENNPRHLFDPEPLATLKKSIREHGVLVPITVYKRRGQDKFFILDGQRRHTCCKQLQDEEGRSILIPANVVEPPTKMAALIYMFSIHNFREQWELMPTALALKTLIDELDEHDNKIISKLTGLSEPQIQRCKILLSFPEEFQILSLDPNPKTRIPSNFWIEAFPVLNLCETHLPDLMREFGRDGITRMLVAKYTNKPRRIKSVIHFRRIMEAFEIADTDRSRRQVLDTVAEYIRDTQKETRASFDPFLLDNRRVQGAINACDEFVRTLQRNKLDYTLDRDDLRASLNSAKDYIEHLLLRLEGSDAPSAFDEDPQ